MHNSGAVSNVRSKLVAAAGGVALLAMAAPSFGSLLVNFKPVPISPTLPELTWTGTQLTAGSGSVGNGGGDGLLPPTQEQIGGLQIETPLTLSDADAIAHGAQINTSTGSTTF